MIDWLNTYIGLWLFKYDFLIFSGITGNQQANKTSNIAMDLHQIQLPFLPQMCNLLFKKYALAK